VKLSRCKLHRNEQIARPVIFPLRSFKTSGERLSLPEQIE
jgi:hypothetical protein